MEHMQKHGTKEEHFAKVAFKNHNHSVNSKNINKTLMLSLENSINWNKYKKVITYMDH